VCVCVGGCVPMCVCVCTYVCVCYVCVCLYINKKDKELLNKKIKKLFSLNHFLFKNKYEMQESIKNLNALNIQQPN
jgi:hypothetical protein